MGTLVSGNMDQNLWSPDGLILTHSHLSSWPFSTSLIFALASNGRVDRPHYLSKVLGRGMQNPGRGSPHRTTRPCCFMGVTRTYCGWLRNPSLAPPEEKNTNGLIRFPCKCQPAIWVFPSCNNHLAPQNHTMLETMTCFCIYRGMSRNRL